MQQLSAKVFKLSFEYLRSYTFVAQKVAIFAEKNSRIVLSKVRFTKNVEIQLEPRFTDRRRPGVIKNMDFQGFRTLRLRQLRK